MEEKHITKRESGQRLDRYLEKYMPQAPRSFFYKMLRKKNIVLNGKKASGREMIQAGDCVKLFLAQETIDGFRNNKERVVHKSNNKIKLHVVYEDDDILVVNKPVGILSQKAEKQDVSLVEMIEQYLQEKEKEDTFRPGICNRLDRNTSGLVVAGKSIRGLQEMNRLFGERSIEKYYLCIVHGTLQKKRRLEGYLRKNRQSNKVTIENRWVSGAVPVMTEYMPLQHGTLQGETYTLLKVQLITGKSHQIRGHLASIGHPLVGDVKYMSKEQAQRDREQFGQKQQLLHAWQLHMPKDTLPGIANKVWYAKPPHAFVKCMQKLSMTQEF